MFTKQIDNKKAQSSVIGFFISLRVIDKFLHREAWCDGRCDSGSPSNMAGKQKLPFIEAILYCIGELRLKALQLKKVKTVAQQKVTFLKALTTANPRLKNYIKPDIQSDLITYTKYELTQMSRCRVKYWNYNYKHVQLSPDIGKFNPTVFGAFRSYDFHPPVAVNSLKI